MKQSVTFRLRLILICACSFVILVVLSSCSGVAGTPGAAGTGSSATITGQVQSVNAAGHSVTLSVNLNGQQQQLTVSGLTDQQIQALQTQVGKTYTLQATGSGDAYTIVSGSDPQENDNATPGVTAQATEATTGAAQGSIDFIGKVQSMNANSIVVNLPDGSSVTAAIGSTTDRGDLPAQVANGQYVKIKVSANADGSFSATKLGTTDTGDTQNQTKLNTVDFTGITSAATGSDNVLHFAVGSKKYQFASAPNFELKDFANLQAIPNNQAVKVEVLYSGANGSIMKVSNGAD